MEVRWSKQVFEPCFHYKIAWTCCPNKRSRYPALIKILNVFLDFFRVPPCNHTPAFCRSSTWRCSPKGPSWLLLQVSSNRVLYCVASLMFWYFWVMFASRTEWSVGCCWLILSLEDCTAGPYKPFLRRQCAWASLKASNLVKAGAK